MAIFVDRNKEIETLLRYVENNVDVMIYGLRGIGKTSLLEKLSEILSKKGIKVLFINGFEITSIYDIATIVGSNISDPKILLSELFLKDDYVIIIDEFTAFLRIFVGKKTFTSLRRAAMFLRTLIEKRKKRGGKSIILCSSAVGIVKRLTRKYFAPLFRQLKTLSLEPMSLEDAVSLAKTLCRKHSEVVVDMVRGMPFYIIKMCEEINAGKEPTEALEYLLSDSSGDFNIYFQGMYEKFSPPERYILHLIARGITRFSKISERVTVDISIYMKRLLLADVIKKIEVGPKEVYYEIKDPVFKAWLALQEIPSLGRMSIKSLIVSSLGFESIVREMLREITHNIEIVDAIGQKVFLVPARVIRYRKNKVEIDALLIHDNEATVIECHFWGPAKKEKISQLEKNSEFVEQNLGLKIKDKILISYFGFEEATKNIAKQKKIKLLAAKQLREIQKILKKNWGF